MCVHVYCIIEVTYIVIIKFLHIFVTLKSMCCVINKYRYCVCQLGRGIRRSRFGFHYFLSNKATTWRQAQRACRRLGMNLARIDSRRENNWLFRSFGRSRPWIGLNDIRRERHFVNVDGCRRRFVAWARGEPNNSGNEDCAQLWTLRGWNDNRCNNRYRYLCKKSNRKVRTRCGRKKVRRSKWFYKFYLYLKFGSTYNVLNTATTTKTTTLTTHHHSFVLI